MDAVVEPRGTVAILGGRGEFIEKYFEVAEDLLSRGLAVATMDWRGQGGSERPLRNARKGHVDDFRISNATSTPSSARCSGLTARLPLSVFVTRWGRRFS